MNSSAEPPGNDLPPVIRPPVDADTNPFAPSATQSTDAAVGRRVELPVYYWLVLFAVLLLLILVSVWTQGAALIAVIALVAAAIRVPLLQLRLTGRDPGRQLPNPLLSLLTSWAFLMVALFAAGIAFVVICIPSGIVMFSSGAPEDSGVMVIFGLSGLGALAAFVLLFVLSLRLPV